MKKLIVFALIAIPLYLLLTQPGGYYGFQTDGQIHVPYFSVEHNTANHLYRISISRVSIYMGYVDTPSGSTLCIGDAYACSYQGMK